jgi:cytochrome d ubiquinol oxidase subunit I
MELDVVQLQRMQFALTIMFHYLFPPLTIGLGVLMVVFEGTYLKTKKPIYEIAARFWTKLFAVSFAVGVASGIVMEFQFGTGWADYSRFVGDVFGSALAAEGIFAFFLESGFLAVLVFGWDRVGPKMHFFSTLMVSLGSIFSSVWIIVANSWQQTPAGHHIINGRAEVVDFWAVVFNHSTIARLTHVWIGAMILGAFFVLSICAWYALKRKHMTFVKTCVPIALVFAFVASLLAPIQGHYQAHNVYENQPAKLAAFEGLYTTPKEGEGAALSLFGIVNEDENKIEAEIAIPGLLSFLIHQDFSKTEGIRGLDQYDEVDRPPVAIPYYTYHTMVGLGMVFILVTSLGMFFLWRGKLYDKRWFLWVLVLAVIGPYIANQAGWVAAEVGRQPFIVYPNDANYTADNGTVTAEAGWTETTTEDGTPRLTPNERTSLRTQDAASKSVREEEAIFSLIIFIIMYFILFPVWLFVLNDKIQRGPESEEEVAAAKKARDERKGTGFAATAVAGADKAKAQSMTQAKQDKPAGGSDQPAADATDDNDDVKEDV